MKIELSGSCTVDRGEELKQLFLEAFEKEDSIELDFQGITDADLSFFLLLHSAQKSAREMGKELIMLPNLPAHLAKRALWAGLSELAAEVAP